MNEKYNWNSLFDGNQHILTQDVDFKCSAETFRSLAYKAAKKRGKNVTVNIDRNIDLMVTVLTLQAE